MADACLLMSARERDRSQSASDRLAAGQHWHRRVIAVDASARHHMRPDQRNQRGQCRAAGAHPVGQGGDVKLDALAGEGLALPDDGPVRQRDFKPALNIISLRRNRCEHLTLATRALIC